MAVKKDTRTNTRSKQPAGRKRMNSPRRKVAAPSDDRNNAIPEQSPSKAIDFPIVGIGASAGGLDAFEQFFTNMPPDSGMAFVVVQHLDPTHKSILADLLRSYTRMVVREVEEGMTVESNSVYVIPPNCDMALLNGQLHLMEPTAPRGLRQPIDFFFRSLSDDRKEKAICVVFSGTGTEGTLGLREIKGQGGMVMVQDPLTGKYDGMPRSCRQRR